MNNSINKYCKEHNLGTFSPKAVLFDMDGVLYDSMPVHAVAWNQAMAKFGIDMPEIDGYRYEGMRGVETIQHMVRQQQNREITEEEAAVMYDEKARIFHSLTVAKVMPGVQEFQRLLQQQGLTIGVVTGSAQKPLIEGLARDFEGIIRPELIVSAKDVKQGKPAPDPYLLGMQKVGTLPHETIVVENAPLGVQSGKAAGCFVIAVNTGPLPDQVLADSGADIIFHNFQEIKEAWEKIVRITRIS